MSSCSDQRDAYTMRHWSGPAAAHMLVQQYECSQQVERWRKLTCLQSDSVRNNTQWEKGYINIIFEESSRKATIILNFNVKTSYRQETEELVGLFDDLGWQVQFLPDTLDVH